MHKWRQTQQFRACKYWFWVYVRPQINTCFVFDKTPRYGDLHVSRVTSKNQIFYHVMSHCSYTWHGSIMIAYIYFAWSHAFRLSLCLILQMILEPIYITLHQICTSNERQNYRRHFRTNAGGEGIHIIKLYIRLVGPAKYGSKRYVAATSSCEVTSKTFEIFCSHSSFSVSHFKLHLHKITFCTPLLTKKPAQHTSEAIPLLW